MNDKLQPRLTVMDNWKILFAFVIWTNIWAVCQRKRSTVLLQLAAKKELFS